MDDNAAPGSLRDQVAAAELTLFPLIGEFEDRYGLTICKTVAIFHAALKIIHTQTHAAELAGDPTHN